MNDETKRIRRSIVVNQILLISCAYYLLQIGGSLPYELDTTLSYLLLLFLIGDVIIWVQMLWYHEGKRIIAEISDGVTQGVLKYYERK